jgi:nucleoside-diphosphate-sugar epimerase
MPALRDPLRPKHECARVSDHRRGWRRRWREPTGDHHCGACAATIAQLRGRGERVRAVVHRDDDRAHPLRELGAEVVVGNLTDAQHVVDAMTGVDRMFFSMSVYLQATAFVSAAALENGRLEVIMNVSQM